MGHLLSYDVISTTPLRDSAEATNVSEIVFLTRFSLLRDQLTP